MANKFKSPRSFHQRFSLILTSVFMAALIIFLIGGINYLRDPQHFPIKVIKIDAAYQHISQAQLQGIISPLINGNFFTISVKEIRQALLAQAWINSVTIDRIWPDELDIRVVEQQPVARWGNNGLLNADNQLFYPPIDTIPAHLPLLRGPDDQVVLVWQTYQQIAAALAPLNISIVELELNARHAWRVLLSTGTQVLLGRLNVDQRIARLIQIYPKIFANQKPPLIIDLRYNNGLAVKWQ